MSPAFRGRRPGQAGFTVGAKIRVRVASRRLMLEVESKPPPDSVTPSVSVHEPRALT